VVAGTLPSGFRSFPTTPANGKVGASFDYVLPTAETRVRDRDRGVPACREQRICHASGDRAQSYSTITGLTTAKLGKRLKSRSALHNSRTPCCAHSAAIRASCTCGPVIFAAVIAAFRCGQ
jgi:hypothetical protein